MSTRQLELKPEAPAKEPAASLSTRDFLIYTHVRLWLVEQKDVARAFGLTQPRVSQIVARVGRELDAVDPAAVAQLAAARDRLDKRWECRLRRKWEMERAMIDYEESGHSLETVKRRTDGNGNLVYTETTIRPSHRNHQALKTIIRLNNEIEAEAALPPPPLPEEALTVAARASMLAQVRDEAQTAKLAEEARALAAAKARREEQERSLAEHRQIYATPQSRGDYQAREVLKRVAAGELTLADGETYNNQMRISTAADYPSYYEKCPANINGVKVAEWVKTIVPNERLPQGDDVWLPVYHCLKDWPDEDRKIEPHKTRILVDGATCGWHFGGRAGAGG